MLLPKRLCRVPFQAPLPWYEPVPQTVMVLLQPCSLPDLLMTPSWEMCIWGTCLMMRWSSWVSRPCHKTLPVVTLTLTLWTLQTSIDKWEHRPDMTPEPMLMMKMMHQISSTGGAHIFISANPSAQTRSKGKVMQKKTVWSALTMTPMTLPMLHPPAPLTQGPGCTRKRAPASRNQSRTLWTLTILRTWVSGSQLQCTPQTM